MRDVQYVVTNRRFGETRYIFDNKQEAINAMNNYNKLDMNSVISEFEHLPSGGIITRPIEENITLASCACIQTKDFGYCEKVPLKDFDDYVKGIKKYVPDGSIVCF